MRRRILPTTIFGYLFIIGFMKSIFAKDEDACVLRRVHSGPPKCTSCHSDSCQAHVGALLPDPLPPSLCGYLRECAWVTATSVGIGRTVHFV